MRRRYSVLITRRAERDKEALDPAILGRVKRALAGLATEPYSRAKKLSRPELGQYRLRVGDWRIVFDVEGVKVIVLRIGHRREIYRRKR